ncbi:hypothetical protein C3L33_05717, partial [Rhododendron williamsianum]
MRLLNEYFGLLVMVSRNASASNIEDGSFTLSNEWWKISAVNSTYTMCPTYPFALLVPECIRNAPGFHIPVLIACNFMVSSRAVLAWSSQPLVGLMLNMRSNANEKLVDSLCTHFAGAKHPH